MLQLFRPSLTPVADLMEGQIREALAKGVYFDKALLVGGFGDSPALIEFLHMRLRDLNKEFDTNIELIATSR